MKKAILLVFMLLFVSFVVAVSTDRATLIIGESFEFEGYNFTLINMNQRTDSALFCLNNEKIIFTQDEVKRQGDAIIEVIDITRNDVRIKVEVDDERICGDECKNTKCFAECKNDLDCDDNNEETIDKCVSSECRNNIVEISDNGDGVEEVLGNGETKEIRKTSDNVAGTFAVVLIGVVVVLGLIVFLTKKK